MPVFAPPVSGGSWVWNVKEKAKSLLVQREASTINTLLFIYLILWVALSPSSTSSPHLSVVESLRVLICSSVTGELQTAAGTRNCVSFTSWLLTFLRFVCAFQGSAAALVFWLHRITYSGPGGTVDISGSAAQIHLTKRVKALSLLQHWRHTCNTRGIQQWECEEAI